MVATPTIESSFTGLLETARPRPVVYPKALAPIRRFFEFAQPRRVRTMREFAEQEIILPTGPERGNLFSTKFMPWTGLLLDEFSAGRYKEFWITAPVQDGKTVLSIITPLMYYLFEMREDVIFGVPRMELAQGRWDSDIKPMIENSRYVSLLPEKGRGSRGGKFEAIYFSNGSCLRFMAGGGGDEQRAGFTAPIVIVDEVDKMDEAGGVSRETDPVTQVRARSDSFAKLGTAVFFGACTMSHSRGRINQEVVVKGTNTKIYIPCPHCRTYIVCERENFKGWQGAKDVVEACENAAYVCQECHTPWTEEDRLHALASPIFVAEGQTVNKDGIVRGDPPRTFGFGLSWNAMYSALKDMPYIAKREFEAVRSEKVDAIKDLMQFAWALPYEEKIEDLSGVTVDTILSKISRHPRGMVPPGTSKITVGVDTGLWWCWYSVWAWTEDAQGYCIDYNDIQVPQPDRHNPDPLNILKALQVFRYEVLEPGWMVATGERTGADLVLVDSGFKNDITYAFTRESGEKFYPSKGFGSKPNQNKWTQPKPGKGRRVGDGWMITRQPGNVQLVNMDADGWKRTVHEGFRVIVGSPGSLSLYHDERVGHLAFAKQVVAERQLEEMTPRGPRTYWRQKGKNHYLDTVYAARCAAAMLGVRSIPRRIKETKTKAPAAERPAAGKRIRTRY